MNFISKFVEENPDPMKKVLLISLILCSHFITSAQIRFQKLYNFGLQPWLSSGVHIPGSGYIFIGHNVNNTLILRINLVGDTLWTRIINDETLVSVTVASPSGFLLSGTCLIKMDNNGNIIWSKKEPLLYLGPIYNLQNGGFICTGMSGNLIKLNSNGNVEWNKNYSGFYNNGIFSTFSSLSSDVQPTFDGGFIIVGSTNLFGSGFNDIYLVKTDSIGNYLWSKTYGSSGNEGAIKIKQTSDGGFIIVGSTNSFGVGQYDLYIIKTDSLGNLIWSKTYGGWQTDNAHDIIIVNDGYVISGVTMSWNYYNLFALKINDQGDKIWENSYGDENDGKAIVLNTTEGYLFATSRT